MKGKHSRTYAFTLVELLVVIAVISILGCLLLPALARTRGQSYETGCLSGMRQMMVGWAMYKDANNDNLLPNAPVSAGSMGWAAGTENWATANANTNPAVYYNSLLAPYINNHIENYRCPADVIPSDNGIRIRSRSMNSQVGGTVQYNSGWRIYLKGSDLTCPQPKSTFIFCDEAMYSLNDGFLQVGLNSPSYPDVPANYHNGAGSFSFADGHAEIHKWVFLNPGAGLMSVPYKYGVGYPQAAWPSSVQDVDWIWLRLHSACKP